MHDDCEELIKLNRVRGVKKARELYIPPFVENNEKLKIFWTKRWEEIVGNSGFIDEVYSIHNTVSYLRSNPTPIPAFQPDPSSPPITIKELFRSTSRKQRISTR
jgi:hypothetical protein